MLYYNIYITYIIIIYMLNYNIIKILVKNIKRGPAPHQHGHIRVQHVQEVAEAGWRLGQAVARHDGQLERERRRRPHTAIHWRLDPQQMICRWWGDVRDPRKKMVILGPLLKT